MPESSIELARAFVGLWNAGERSLDAIERYCDPDVELRSPFSSVIGEPYRGHAGVQAWAQDVDDQFSQWSLSVDSTRSVGDRVIVISTVDARGRVSGLTMSFAAACVLEFGPDRRIARIHIYSDVDEGLKSVGLEQ